MSFLPIDPNGCHHCGKLERDHGARWSAVAGIHGYVAPNNGQRLHRMKVRRAARLAAKQPPRPAPPECYITFVVKDPVTPAVKGAIESLDFYQWTNEMRDAS